MTVSGVHPPGGRRSCGVDNPRSPSSGALNDPSSHTDRWATPAAPTAIRTALAYNLSIADVHTYHVGDGSVLVHNDCFQSFGSGLNLLRDATIDGVRMRVKSGHGYRADHGSIDITSVLRRDEVDLAVATDLAARVKGGTNVAPAGSGNHTTFQTTLGGYQIEYRSVFVPATGRYDISTYYIP